MTHKDIYTKFMIEYDKANVTSSYPSLTEYEVATVLDKAYHALIAQKVTGNNIRRVAFEQDLKAIEDVSPLIKRVTIESPSRIKTEEGIAPNVKSIQLEPDHLYFIGCYLKYTMSETPMDDVIERMVPTVLMPHQQATKFYSTAYNLPWIKTPVAYIEDDRLFIVYDPINSPKMQGDKFVSPEIVYIKAPNKFVKDLQNGADGLQLSDEEFGQVQEISYFSYKTRVPGDVMFQAQFNESAENALRQMYTFECSDTMAEELISLAVAFALENVESQRLNSKLNMRGLEA